MHHTRSSILFVVCVRVSVCVGVCVCVCVCMLRSIAREHHTVNPHTRTTQRRHTGIRTRSPLSHTRSHHGLWVVLCLCCVSVCVRVCVSVCVCVCVCVCVGVCVC